MVSSNINKMITTRREIPKPAINPIMVFLLTLGDAGVVGSSASSTDLTGSRSSIITFNLSFATSLTLSAIFFANLGSVLVTEISIIRVSVSTFTVIIFSNSSVDISKLSSFFTSCKTGRVVRRVS